MGVECNNFKKVNVEVPAILHLEWRGICKSSMQHCLCPCSLPATPKLNLNLGVTFSCSSICRPTLPQPKKKRNVSATVSASVPLLRGRPKQNQENQDEGREEHSVTDEVREKLAYLESIEVDTYGVIAKNPSISSTSLNSIQSVVKFLQAMGILDTDLGRLFNICPEALTASVPCQLRPVFTFLLREVHIPATRLRRVIYRRPRLLACSVKEQLRPTLYFLQRLGFTDVGKYSFLLPCSVEGKLMPRLQYFQNLGLSYKDAVLFERVKFKTEQRESYIGDKRKAKEQEDLETFDGVSKGKYTIGLGQDCMTFCTDLEDVISMSLTAVTSLLEKYEIDPKQIGRLEVGSETVIDKSKSIKTWLMHIFEKCGNTEIEGVDSTNACYGGTAALFNCINWIESSSWDGRYGLVVATDSAVYAEGAARPTGGAAAVAMLIGPNAPIATESKYRGTHMAHVYDFYKPNLASEYPVVDGKLSQTCYLMALDSCYKRFCNKFEKEEGRQFSLLDTDYIAFHSPYNKLVQKSFGRLLFNDFSRHARSVGKDAQEKLEPFAGLSEQDSYNSRDLEKVSQQLAKPLYDAKIQPSTLLPKQVGNMYTASLYAALASIIHNKHTTLDGQRVMMFSYGSGLASTLFSFKIREGQFPFTLSNITEVMDVQNKLDSRHEFLPEDFVENLKRMETLYGAKDFVSTSQLSLLRPGAFYLTKVDSMYRRFYSRKVISAGDNFEKSKLANGTTHDEL